MIPHETNRGSHGASKTIVTDDMPATIEILMRTDMTVTLYKYTVFLITNIVLLRKYAYLVSFRLYRRHI